MSSDASHQREEIRSQHIELRRQSERVRAVLSSKEARDDVVHAFRRLELVLSTHFAYEEDGGYMQEIRERFPNEDGAIVRLERSHAGLRQTLREMRELVSAAGDWAALEHPYARWLEQLWEHEEAEERLIKLMEDGPRAS